MQAYSHRLSLFRNTLVCLVVLPVWAAAQSPATQSGHLQFPLSDLNTIHQGQWLRFELPQLSHPVAVLVEHDSRYINGDRMISGRDETGDVTLVLTLSDDAAFADLTVHGERWLFEGQRDGQWIRGRLYQPDAIILDRQRADYVVRDPLALLPSDTDSSSGSASRPSSHGGRLSIAQRFSVDAALVGERTDVSLRVTVANGRTQPVSRPQADIYFLLEDTELISAPGCSRQMTTGRSPQPILRCDLGGQLAAGAQRELDIRVSVPPYTEPTRVLSTVFVGDVRQDAWLNVVRDVLQTNSQLMGVANADTLGNVVIDVLALRTPDTTAMYGPHVATRINQLISVANQIYRDSGVAITLRPVYHGEVPYPGNQIDFYTQLDQLTTGQHPAFRDVAALRERYGADIVVLFRPMTAAADLCGLANLGGYQTRGDMTAFNEADIAQAIVGIDCPLTSVLAHELGHVMGLTHSRREDGQGGSFSFGTGHAVDHQFATVMANPAYFGNARRIPLFSSPALNCGGQPCGIDFADTEQGADAALALNLVRFQVANYRPTRVPEPPSRLVASTDGRATSTRIALAATVDGGVNYTYSISPGQRMDIKADMYVDPAHVGRAAQFHVIADLTAAGLGYLQLSETGQVFPWSGELSDLRPYRAAEALRSVEYLAILQQFRPLPELVGHPLILYIAYQLLDNREVVFTAEPLQVQITDQP